MSYGRHIHITGPARSGTTLMKNLMHCYMGTFVTLGESHPSPDLPRRINITKYPEDGPELYDNYPNLNVIYMVRDPRDMCVSRREGVRWWYNRDRLSPGCFDRRVDDFLTLASSPSTFVVKYEELVSDPERVQAEVADRFYLSPLCSFTEGHKFFLEDPRPLDTSSVGAWRREDNKLVVKDWLSSNPGAARYIQHFGYEEE